MISIPFLKTLGRQDSIGIDFGTKALKCVKLQRPRAGIVRLVSVDVLDLPEDEAALIAALRDYVVKKGLSGTPAAAGIQSDSLHIHRLELPRMPEADLKEAIRWQMRDIAEGSLDDYVVRHSVQEEVTTGDITRIVLTGYAVKKSAVASQIRLLERAGLKPFFVEPTPVSLSFSMERTFPPGEKEWIAGVDIGFKRASFLAVSNGKLRFVRPMAGVPAGEALLLKEEYATKLAMEIQHAIDALSIGYHVEKIEKIFLAGGGAGHPGLAVSLSKNLGVGVELLNPFVGIEMAAPFALAAEKPYLFGAALGLAFLKP